MLGLVVIRGFGEFDHLIEDDLRKTNVEGGHRHSCMVRRFDLLDAIINLSSKPVSACRPSRRTAAEENHHTTDESNQREVKYAVIAKAVGAALHNIDHSTNIVSRGNALRHVGRPRRCSTARRQEGFREHMSDLFGDIDCKAVLDVACDTGENVPLLVHRSEAGGCRAEVPHRIGRRARHRRLL